MSTPADIPGQDVPHANPAVPLSATRPLHWSIRRELWESRSVYIAPLVVAAVVLVAFMISTYDLPAAMRTVSRLDPVQRGGVVMRSFDMVGLTLFVTGTLVGAFYCLDALYGERRDRSILFWKSLPVSDVTAVAAKASIPLVVMPILVFGLVVAVQAMMLLWSALVLALNGMSVAFLWSRLPFLQNAATLLYALVVIALWHAPLYAWLLLVSAWARRAPLMWALLPPLALAAVERIAFGTSHFGGLLKYRLFDGIGTAFVVQRAVDAQAGMLPQLTPLRFLANPGLWLGLVVAVAFLAAAARLRRYAEPI